MSHPTATVTTHLHWDIQCKFLTKMFIRWIKKTTDILVHKYDSDIPDSYEGLIQLPGVGEKVYCKHCTQCLHCPCRLQLWLCDIVGESMSFGLCLVSLSIRSTGIAVDVHIHRVCNRLGWVSTKGPSQTKQVHIPFLLCS